MRCMKHVPKYYLLYIAKKSHVFILLHSEYINVFYSNIIYRYLRYTSVSEQLLSRDMSEQVHTVSAIAAFLNEIYKNINRNKNSYIIYLDLKKAFDTISHSKLLNKLQNLGIDDLTLKWFVSYLTGRRQCVKLNDITSNTLPITYGVPQGSILGPILFSLYINPLQFDDFAIFLY